MKGQYVYVNRPQNNAYAEECKVEICKQRNLYRARSQRDQWAHYFTGCDIGNDVFFKYEDAQAALRCMVEA